ncbi:MAG: hypothetical protein HYT97_09450, partial [Elusimicrobia bacterium]|nr:hypothetical protein [Elusimicrobiota bacterium]
MAIVFFYVQVGYGVIEPLAQSQREKKYAKLWEERKAAVKKLRNQDQGEENVGESSAVVTPARVVPPKQEDSFISQLPALNLNILKNSIFRVEPFAPSASDYSIDSDDKEMKISRLVKSLPTWFQSVPVQFANLEDLYLPPNWKMNDFMVIHIMKRVHSSSKSKIVVGLEGAEGSFNFTPYRSFPDKQIVKEVADHLLKESLISGVEFVGMTLNLTDSNLSPQTPRHTTSPQSLRYSSLAGNRESPQSNPSPQTPISSSLSLAGHPLLFWGIEDRNLYSQHVRAFKDSVLIEKQAKQSLFQLKSVMNHLKPNILNPELQKLDSNISQYYQGTLSLSSYLKHLTEPGIPSNSPMIRNYMNALVLEETLDFDKVETERRYLTNALTEKLSKSELTNLVSASLSYRLGNISYGLFYHYLLELCKAYGIGLSQWPEMDKYVRYVLISDKIKSADLFREMGELEQKRVKSLISTPNEKAFIDLSQDVGVIEKMVEFKLSPEEWEQYAKRKDEIKKIGVRIAELREIISNRANLPNRGKIKIKTTNLLDKKEIRDSKIESEQIRENKESVSTISDLTFKFEVLESFERFNEAAMSRNSALVNNLLKKVYNQTSSSSNSSIRQPSIAVLVAGGFHTTGVTELLKQKKIAYAVFSPKLGIVEGSGADYLNLFRRDKTPLEKLFVGERITLKSPIGTTTEPLGEEVPFVLPALEGEFSTLAVARYVLKNLKLHTNISKELRKEYTKTILNWIQDENQFHTIHKIQIREIEESRDHNGTINNLRITLDITGPINGESKTRTLTVSQFAKEEGGAGAVGTGTSAGAGGVGAGTNAGTGVSGDGNGDADVRAGARVSGGVSVGAGQTIGMNNSAKEVMRFKYGDETIVFIQEPRTLTQKAMETAGVTARSILPLVLPIWKKIFSQTLLNNRLFVSTVIPILELWGLPGFSLALASLLGIWVSAVPVGLLIWISVPVGAFLFALLHGIPQPQEGDMISQGKELIPQETRAPPLNTTQTAPTTGVGLKGWNSPQTDTGIKVSAPLIGIQTYKQFMVRFVATMVIASIAILLSSFLTPYLLPHALPFIQNIIHPFGLDISSKIVQDLLTYLFAGGLHGVFNWFAPQEYRLSITGTLPPLVTPVTPPTQMTPENKISILPSPPERQIAVVKKTQGSKIVSLQSFRRDKEKRDGDSSSADTPTGKGAFTGVSAGKTAVTSVGTSAQTKEWINPMNWIPNIKAILISAVLLAQTLNPAAAFNRIASNLLLHLNQPILAEKVFNFQIKQRELKIANQEMSRIAPSILEDMESLNRTPIPDLKDKL